MSQGITNAGRKDKGDRKETNSQQTKSIVNYTLPLHFDPKIHQHIFYTKDFSKTLVFFPNSLTNTYTHTQNNICTQKHIHIDTHMFTHTHTQTQANTQTHKPPPPLTNTHNTHTHTHIHTHIPTPTQADRGRNTMHMTKPNQQTWTLTWGTKAMMVLSSMYSLLVASRPISPEGRPDSPRRLLFPEEFQQHKIFYWIWINAAKLKRWFLPISESEADK